MSDSFLRVLWLTILVMALAVGCGSTTPPPPTPTPTVAPGQTAAPVPSDGASPGTSPAPGVNGNPAADLLAAESQPALPGLYLPAGVRALGNDHFALIQAPFGCPTLTDVLGAGQWTVADHAQLSIPTPGPGETPQPMPSFSLPEWLLLRSGDEAAVARMGGDETGCLAQVWRLAKADYEIHGAIESTGQADALQVQCAVAGGMAEVGLVFFGGDGTMYNFNTTVPLTLGSHAIPLDSDVHAGQPGVTIEQAFPVFYGGQPEDSDVARVEEYGPADPAAGGWQGSIEVTSLEPLIGRVSFEDLRNEGGESLTLATGFRCDLRPGQLARAAEEAANASPTPAASPSPAPGQLSVDIAAGRHAGTQQLTSADMTCSLGLFGTGDWTVSYNAPEYVAGEVQSLTVTAHANGKADVFMTLGDDLDHDWFNTDSAQADVTDNGASVDIVVNGRGAGSDFTIVITCYDIFRF